MSTTVSVSRRHAVAVRISRTAISTATAIAGTVSTIIGLAVGSDLLTYLAATVSLAAVYSLDKKGGER